MPRYGSNPSGPSSGGGRYTARPTEPVAQPAESGPSPLALGAAAGAAGLAGLALKNPSMARKAYDAVLAARYIPMLSGFALPKSMLGNVGTAAMTSLERGSMRPLKELFSSTTAREFASELANPTVRGTGASQIAQQAGRYNPFGRVIGAADSATQSALRRAGLTGAEAAERALQSPLPASIAKTLGTPAGRYFVPFQRTPFNQFLQTFKGISEHPKIAAGAATAGALTGATTEDYRTPGIAAPLTGRYAGPFVLGAYAGRALSGGADAEKIATGLSPTSDSAMVDPIRDPLKPFRQPSILGLLKYFGVE